MAEEALLEAWIRFKVTASNGPIAVYKCDDCGYYHLTSKGPMNETLSKYLAEGKLKRDQESRWWEDKLR